MSAHLTLIASKKYINVKFNALINKLQKNDFVSFHYDKEVYWKDTQKVKIDVTIDCENPLSELIWRNLFNDFSDHISVFYDDAFMEIALFSDLSNEDDLLMTLHVPLIMVKKVMQFF